MTTDHMTEKARSYRVHNEVADALGQPRFHAYSHVHGPLELRARRDIVMGDIKIGTGEAVRLVSTSNAGFRGIVAHVETPEGFAVWDVSLGAFDVVRP